jgi:hypothetical protein
LVVRQSCNLLHINHFVATELCGSHLLSLHRGAKSAIAKRQDS